MGKLSEKINNLLEEELRYPEVTCLKQRGIADKIESRCNRIISRHFQDTRLPSSRRSLEDISIGNTYVDHKSSDESLEFKMPNLISIDRLKSLDRPLIYNFVQYNSKDKEIIKTFSLNVFELNWKYLRIQNLGVGQLQISNMKKFSLHPKGRLSKKDWKKRLDMEAIKFYDNLITKTVKRKKKWA